MAEVIFEKYLNKKLKMYQEFVNGVLEAQKQYLVNKTVIFENHFKMNNFEEEKRLEEDKLTDARTFEEIWDEDELNISISNQFVEEEIFNLNDLGNSNQNHNVCSNQTEDWDEDELNISISNQFIEEEIFNLNDFGHSNHNHNVCSNQTEDWDEDKLDISISNQFIEEEIFNLNDLGNSNQNHNVCSNETEDWDEEVEGMDIHANTFKDYMKTTVFKIKKKHIGNMKTQEQWSTTFNPKVCNDVQNIMKNELKHSTAHYNVLNINPATTKTDKTIKIVFDTEWVMYRNHKTGKFTEPYPMQVSMFSKVWKYNALS